MHMCVQISDESVVFREHRTHPSSLSAFSLSLSVCPSALLAAAALHKCTKYCISHTSSDLYLHFCSSCAKNPEGVGDVAGREKKINSKRKLSVWTLGTSCMISVWVFFFDYYFSQSGNMKGCMKARRLDQDMRRDGVASWDSLKRYRSVRRVVFRSIKHLKSLRSLRIEFSRIVLL